MSRAQSAAGGQLVATERVNETMRQLLHQEVKVARRFSLEEIAAHSGVSLRLLRCWMSNDKLSNREPKLSAALSVAVVLGRRAVNVLIALIGYTTTPLDDEDGENPARDTAEMLGQLAIFAKATFDNIIDHTEDEPATAAADKLIDLAMPYSSRGKAS